MRFAKRALIALLCLTLIGVAAAVMLGLQEAKATPVVRQTTIKLAGSVNGDRIRIALLSDIHIGSRTMSPTRLSRIVEQVNRTKPDLVVIVGDFVNGSDGMLDSNPSDLVSPLSRLQAPLGVVATLGNHDHWTAPEQVRQALEQASITVLSNRSKTFGPVIIVGIDDGYSGHDDIDAATAHLGSASNRPVIAISHSPDLAPRLPSNVRLLLAGHTHCGQMVLPVVGPLAPIFGKVVGDQHYYDARYRCGRVNEAERTTIVTAGLGSGAIPLRLGAPPDWWLVTVE